MATGAVMGIVSAVVSAAGAAYGAYQSKKAADYNEAVYEQEAANVKKKAAYDEGMHRERVRRLLSSQRALYGKSGLEMSGSPLLVQEDTVAQGEMDALAIRYGGDVNAARSRSSATLARMQGRSAQVSGYTKAGTSLLSGYSQYKSSQ